MADSRYFHSPIKVWKQGNRINVKIEMAGVLLSVSPTKHPKQFERLESLLKGEGFNPIVYNPKETE
ncbi:hypothetical protein LG298_07420 [Cytobacillus firmus]|uniref:hypothetical protein n=1 Tax=Cytobacillus firmus TaxID=1399 RepID=UPI00384DC8DE